MRVPFHVGGQPRHGLPAHDAVGIQHDHMIVPAAKARHPFGDIARLAPDIERAAAIIDRARKGVAHFQIGALFGFAAFGVGIGQDEKFEPFPAHHLRQAALHDRQPAEHAQKILVADRQQDRGLAAQRFGRAQGAGGDAAPLAHGQQQKADGGRGETESDPGKEGNEESQIDALQRADAIQSDGTAHVMRGKRGGDQRKRDHQQAARPQVDIEAAARDERRRRVEILLRHGERAFGRHLFKGARHGLFIDRRVGRRRDVLVHDFGPVPC